MSCYALINYLSKNEHFRCVIKKGEESNMKVSSFSSSFQQHKIKGFLRNKRRETEPSLNLLWLINFK